MNRWPFSWFFSFDCGAFILHLGHMNGKPHILALIRPSVQGQELTWTCLGGLYLLGNDIAGDKYETLWGAHTST